MPEPAAAITSPPSAGPIARATLNPAEFRAMPAAKFWWETISGVIACQAGSFSTAPNPISSVSKRSSVGVIFPASVSAPRRGRRQHHPALREEQQLAAVHHVGDGARRQHDQKDRDAACRLHQSHHQRRHGERGHQPCGADVLHPGAGIADDGCDPERAKQRFVQRPEHGTLRRDGHLWNRAQLGHGLTTGRAIWRARVLRCLLGNTPLVPCSAGRHWPSDSDWRQK